MSWCDELADQQLVDGLAEYYAQSSLWAGYTANIATGDPRFSLWLRLVNGQLDLIKEGVRAAAESVPRLEIRAWRDLYDWGFSPSEAVAQIVRQKSTGRAPGGRLASVPAERLA
jgi:hypothetical protein